MKATLVITSAVLALMLGIAVPVFAQNDKQGDKQDQPKQQQKANDQVRPAQQHDQQPQNQGKQQQQQKQDQNNQQQQRAQQQQNQDNQQKQVQQQQKQDQNNQQQQRAQQQQRPQRTQEQQRVEQTTFQSHRAGNWQSDHRSWQQRGGYNGYRIPDDRYRGYFGSQHYFRIHDLPFMVYGGFPRFQYQGYWITLLDPWPENWSNDWYDNDDVYINYGNDGYYMYNRRYPGIGIAVSISM
jgi:flagellar motor protein MotB